MATAPAVGDILKHVNYCRAMGQNGLNVRHWRVSFQSGVAPSLDDVALALDDIFRPLYTAYLLTSAQHLGTTLQKINPLPVGDEGSTSRSGVPGVVEGTPLPPQCCGHITLNTGVAGRANRGRMYLPFWAEEQCTGAVPTAGAIALMLPIGVAHKTVQTFVIGAGSITLQPIIWRRASETYIQITSGTIQPHFSTQRRRSLVHTNDDALIPILAD